MKTTVKILTVTAWVLFWIGVLEWVGVGFHYIANYW